MSTGFDDLQLLRRYADDASDEAFAELVNHHIDYVWSAALREIHDPHAASDLTQAAFILLARKGKELRGRKSLSGWLFQTVCFAARNTRRAVWRRAHYEKEAAAMIPANPESETVSLWEQFSPLLNDALASLSVRDRDVVTLRFFEKKSHEEIAARLGVGEAVARKCLSRAVERLRLFFARRGVRATGASLILVLGTHSVSAAPAGLAGTVTASALAKGATLSESVLALAQGASQPLRLLALLGSQAYPPEKGWLRVRLDAQGKSIEERFGLPTGGYLKLVVESGGTEAARRVTLMAVTDERGRHVTIERGGSSQNEIQNYLLAAGPDARSLTLQLVRQESRSVSFVARPIQVGWRAHP